MPEKHPQENPETDFCHKSATNTSTIYTKPDDSVIQWLYQANKCESSNSKSSSPSMYKLNVNDLFIQEIQLFSFAIGKRNSQLPEKVILLVGATGAGKSTLINGMVNYMFGVKWEDQERLILTEISKVADQAISQTNSVNVYKISHSKRDRLLYNLTIIDTPGFADTDGLSEDQTIMTKIRGLLTTDEIIDHIDGIGFVVQASLGRLTPTQSYVINSVYSLFGSDVTNNIFVLATFSDPLSLPHVKSALDEAEIKYNTIFKFNNSALYAKTKGHTDSVSLNKLSWEMGMKSFDTFFGELEKINSVSLTLTKDALNERKKLQILLEGLQTQINHEFVNMQRLKDEETTLIKCKNEVEKNENFQYLVDVPFKEKIREVPHYDFATNCDRCQWTCHRNCVESRYNGRCYMMTSFLYITEYTCKLCGCPINVHSYSHDIYVTKCRTETKTVKNMKKKYEKAQSEQTDIERIIKDINNELQTIHGAVREKLSDIHKCIQRINKISLRPNLILEADYISTLIASERAEQTKGYTTRLEFYEKILKELSPETTV